MPSLLVKFWVYMIYVLVICWQMKVCVCVCVCVALAVFRMMHL